jgi:hypothetical protein
MKTQAGRDQKTLPPRATAFDLLPQRLLKTQKVSAVAFYPEAVILTSVS